MAQKVGPQCLIAFIFKMPSDLHTVIFDTYHVRFVSNYAYHKFGQNNMSKKLSCRRDSAMLCVLEYFC